MVLMASLPEWDRDKRLEVCFIIWDLCVTKDTEGLRDVTMGVYLYYLFILLIRFPGEGTDHNIQYYWLHTPLDKSGGSCVL